MKTLPVVFACAGLALVMASCGPRDTPKSGSRSKEPQETKSRGLVTEGTVAEFGATYDAQGRQLCYVKLSETTNIFTFTKEMALKEGLLRSYEDPAGRGAVIRIECGEGWKLRISCEPTNASSVASLNVLSRTATKKGELHMTDKTRNRIAFWIGIAGGGIFQILNAVTNGEIPGGGRGGVLGLIVLGGPAWLILYLIQRRQRHAAQQPPGTLRG